MIVLRGLLVQMCCVALMLLAGCAVPSPDEFESLLTQRDEVAVNEKQRADLMLLNFERDGQFLPANALLGRGSKSPKQYLSALVKHLYPDDYQRYQIRIARLPGENALALSSGVVVVHLGLLAALRNEHQLAFVLAHEIEHINARHGYVGAHLRRNARARAHLGDILTLGSGASYRYYANALRSVSRQQELEADRRAAKVLMRAGLDVHEAAGFFSVLGAYPGTVVMSRRPGTHPDNSLRQRELQSLAQSYRYGLQVGAQAVRSLPEVDSFDQFRQQMLQLSIVDKIADLDLLTALIQLQELESVHGNTEFVRCARGDANYRMATTQPLIYAESVYALEQQKRYLQKKSAWEPPVVFNESSSRLYFLNRALRDFESLHADEETSACAHRGLALTLAEMGHRGAAANFLRTYKQLSPQADDEQFVVYRVNRGTLNVDNRDAATDRLAITEPLVDVVLHRVVDDPRNMMAEERRLQLEIETAIRTALDQPTRAVNPSLERSDTRVATVRKNRFTSARLLNNYRILTARQRDTAPLNLGTDVAEFANELNADKLLLSRYRGWRKTSAQWRKERTSAALHTVATLGRQRTRGYPQFGELELLLLDGKSGQVAWRGILRGDPQSVLESIPNLLRQIAR